MTAPVWSMETAPPGTVVITNRRELRRVVRYTATQMICAEWPTPMHYCATERYRRADGWEINSFAPRSHLVRIATEDDRAERRFADAVFAARDRLRVLSSSMSDHAEIVDAAELVNWLGAIEVEL